MTWEMVVRGRISKPLPPLVQGIERKSWLKLLGIIFEKPSDWEIHADNLFCKASRRLCILRVCKYFGYPKDQLTTLFDVLIMPLFLYGIKIWGATFQEKYLDRIDKFSKRAFKVGYTNDFNVMNEVIGNQDCKLWKTITDNPSHPLFKLLSLKDRYLCEIEGIILFYLQPKQNVLKDLQLIVVSFNLSNCSWFFKFLIS